MRLLLSGIAKSWYNEQINAGKPFEDYYDLKKRLVTKF